jgi:hypothetical protein
MPRGSGVEAVASGGCARLVLPGMHQPFSSVASSSSASRGAAAVGARADRGGPFAGLVVCVTGLSKGARLSPREIRPMNIASGRLFDWCLLFSRVVAEARGQVKEATERLGGEYSGSLHPKCTHLVVQISFTRHGPLRASLLLPLVVHLSVFSKQDAAVP